jgi:hypothetical protein
MSQPFVAGGVPVPPNRCEIKAQVLSKGQDPNFSDKHVYAIKILESRAKEGPNHARPGDILRAFSFESADAIAVGDSISAEAEFIGGLSIKQGQPSVTGELKLTRVALAWSFFGRRIRHAATSSSPAENSKAVVHQRICPRMPQIARSWFGHMESEVLP